MDTDTTNTACASENCSREPLRAGYCAHCHAFQMSQVIIRHNYLPDDLDRLASRLEGETISSIKSWISGLGDKKPLTLLRVVLRIEAICQTFGVDENVIVRRLVGWCRNVPKFHAQVAEFDEQNGGPGTYQKAALGIVAKSLKLAGGK